MRFLILNDGGYEGFKAVTFPIEVEGEFSKCPETILVKPSEVLPHGYDMTYLNEDIGGSLYFVFYTHIDEIQLLRKL